MIFFFGFVSHTCPGWSDVDSEYGGSKVGVAEVEGFEKFGGIGSDDVGAVDDDGIKGDAALAAAASMPPIMPMLG